MIYFDDVAKENINKHNLFDNMIADMLTNKKLNPTITELFIRSRKLNISLAFITQSCFTVPKNIRGNSIHYFIMKISNKQEFQQKYQLYHQLVYHPKILYF